MKLELIRILDTFKGLSWQDLIDVGIVFLIIYRILLLMQGTRALQMMAGLTFLVFLYFVSDLFQLLTLHWILNTFMSSIFILIIIIFQDDIRKALAQIGRAPFAKIQTQFSYGIEEVVKAVTFLAERKIGALIVFERENSLREFIEGSTGLDSKISEELLISIFNPESPLHDGAVIISKDKVLAAGVILPLSTNPDIAKDLGTRHRAAIGITEITDAVAIVVSEETGYISIAVNGKINRDITPATLRKILSQLLGFESEAPWWKRVRLEYEERA
ncbi:MAG: diadenylate cyclase CdaA [Thermodesulfobacteriaceae bacterium]|nr:diadenylate cyclase CdaA [Thermodesulfobacteriaceae bacterium]MCX8042123.1 diadenylate cyclase CdaA [Thermodesulfobacteriaceae bacterium]MDW8135743.1 diadenylate cyclase CdaA [Thermodesulfobacterium sp.]